MREIDILLGILVRGDLEDIHTTAPRLHCFEDDEPIAVAIDPDHYIQLTPYSTLHFKLENIRYRFEPENACTFQLRLFERYAVDQVEFQRRLDCVYNSGAGLLGATTYGEVPGGAAATVPIPVQLNVAGRLYFQIDWTPDDPGTVYGKIKVRGKLMGEFDRAT